MVEHELALVVGVEGDEGDNGACVVVESDNREKHTVGLEDAGWRKLLNSSSPSLIVKATLPPIRAAAIGDVDWARKIEVSWTNQDD